LSQSTVTMRRNRRPHHCRASPALLGRRVKVSEVPCYVAYAMVLSTGLDEYVRWGDSLSGAREAEHERSAFDFVTSVGGDAMVILPTRGHRPPDGLADSA
jgi:hypothetical protein